MFAAPKILIASGLLLASVRAFGAEETSTVATAPALPSAIVKCPGVTSIPLTDDAEQALPMHIVGSLACGEIVSVLTDEGYTARVRTPDGKEGYVARMYLIERGNAAPAPVRHASAEVSATGIARWSAGAPGCHEFLSHGRHVESITANGVTVQVSVQDTRQHRHFQSVGREG